MTATTTDTTPAPDYDAIKTKQQATWSTGNYAVIGTTLQIVGEELCEAVDISAGSDVLDVAAGNGNASLAAARRGARVTATDYVPDLLGQLEARAAADGLTIATGIADAEALDAPDDSYDAVLSTFGVMFTPNQPRAAAELARVCRPGGRIGLANWTPQGFVGQMFKVIGKYAAPPAGVRPPLEWGTENRLYELFGSTVSRIDVTEKDFLFRYRSAAEFVETFHDYYGPMAKAFAAQDDDGATALFADLVALADAGNTATDGTLRLPSAYLEVVAHVA